MSSIFRAATLRLVALLFLGVFALPSAARAQQDPSALPFQRALELFNAGNYREAASQFEAIPRDHPNSPLIPDAVFRLGYTYYLLKDYDKSVAELQKVSTLQNVPPDIAELSASMTPQVISAKASQMAQDSPARRTAFEDAVKQFDAFIARYGQSEEVESANYGKAIALYQLQRYDEAATALRANLQRFPTSETILDSQYLLALTLGTLANTNMQAAAEKAEKDKTEAAPLDKNYDEAERLLRDVIAKRTDIALANDARFQIGEILFAKAAYSKTPEDREKTLLRAMDEYRLVASKDLVVLAQKARVEAYRQRRTQALQQRDVAMNKRLQRVVEKEQEKLAAVEGRGDQTLVAKFKMGQIFFQQGRSDESRVVLRYVQPFIEDAEQKKAVDYFIALGYAAQNVDKKGAVAALGEKAVSSFEEFMSKYKADPIAENLAVVLGAGFVDSDPQQAIKFFQRSLADYPNGRFSVEALTQQAAALVKLQRYEDAQRIFNETLGKKPSKEISASAEFGIATIYQKTGKLEEAVNAFRNIRERYVGSKEAEQASFWVGQLSLERGEPKVAQTELDAFLKKFPNSDTAANAMYFLAQAQTSSNQKNDALQTYKDLAAKFPKSEVAPFSYFQRGQILLDEQKFEDVITLMREFIKNYPTNSALYQAFEFIAQIYSSQGKDEDAIKTYEEFAASFAQDTNAPQALLRVTDIWRTLAEKLGRYIALTEEQRKVWVDALGKSMAASEAVVEKYPESPQVASALKSLLEIQKLRQQAKLITGDDVQTYFAGLATKFQDKPSTRSKIIFTQASYTFEDDKNKAVEQMAGAYDPSLKYAADDLDLYGLALIQKGKLDDANKVYEKLAADYPNPATVDPTKAARDIQEAQAISLFGRAKVLQEKKQLEAAQKLFDELTRLYAWSPKMAEANYGIALSFSEQKKFSEAMELLRNVIRANTAPAELRAKAMLALAKIHEEQANIDSAIDNYIKIAAFYEGVPAVAAEGLWRGAQLLERQGSGQLPVATPEPKPSAKQQPQKKKAH